MIFIALALDRIVLYTQPWLLSLVAIFRTAADVEPQKLNAEDLFDDTA